MKENKYDDQVFFEKYSQMARSQQGLEGAGEWGMLRNMLPEFTGKAVLDIGCGYGWHSLYAAQHGATHVIGVDISEKMLTAAREKNAAPEIEYRVSSFEDCEFAPESFDVIICSLTLHYLASYDEFVSKVRAWLRPGGVLIYNVEHPVFTAYGSQDWYYDANGNILHFPVDNYFIQGKREAVFLGEHVIKYHRTLTTYLSGLLAAGFELLGVAEPEPAPDMLDMPGMRDELRRPMMLIVSARKRN